MKRRRTVRHRRAHRRKRIFRRSTRKRGHRPRMTKVRRQTIRGVNYIADKTIVRFRYEQQFNVKQGAAVFGTDNLYPGNYLPPGASLPTLAEYIAIYSFARIRKSTISCDFTNVEATFSKDV